MKNKSFRYLSLLLLLVVFISGIGSAKVKFDQQLYKKLAEGKNEAPYIKLPDYKRIELDNKLVIYLVEDHNFPTVEVTGYIDGGRSQETESVAGISDFMLQMMNTGTQNFGQQELARYKEINGLDFGFSIQNDYYKFSGSSLTTDKEKLISLVADILRNPDFDANYYSRIKQEISRNLAQAKTRQSSLLNMYFMKNIYQDHPYSYANDYDLRQQTLKDITAKKLQNFYQQNIAPNNVVLGVVGDIDSNKLANLIKEKFGSWEEEKIDFKTPKIKQAAKNKSQIILVHKSDATQAKIRMGYNFFAAGFKGRIAFKMANKVYGGGSFSSRLMEDLRSDKGYVYTVYANQSYNRYGGAYYVNTEVKPSKTYQTIKIVKEKMSAIKNGENKITEKELAENINLYNALLPKSYQNKVDVLGQVIYNSEIRGRKVDYINQFINKYNQLTAQKAQQTFAKYSYPNKFFTVIVGNKEEILPQFKSENINIKVINPN